VVKCSYRTFLRPYYPYLSISLKQVCQPELSYVFNLT